MRKALKKSKQAMKHTSFVGVLTAMTAYGFWGVLPLYWRLLSDRSAYEILFNRTFWCLILLTLLLSFTRSWGSLQRLISSPQAIANAVVSTAVIGTNWFIYIWAVNQGRVIETSLGYYLTPLFSVVFGTLFLKEKLRTAQWLAVALAATGVCWLARGLTGVPWIGLSLALTFSSYGFLKKFLELEALIRLWFETLVLAIGLYAYVLVTDLVPLNDFFIYPSKTQLYLVGTGLMTAVPMLCYGLAVKRLKLSTLGLMQYFSPTMQLLIGVFVFNEEFTVHHLEAFLCIWAAIAVFSLEGVFVFHRKRRKLRAIGHH